MGLMLLHYLERTKIRQCVFSLKCYITGLPDFNHLMLDFFNLVDVHVTLMLL